MFRNSPKKAKTSFRYIRSASAILTVGALSVFLFANNKVKNSKYEADNEAFGGYLKTILHKEIASDSVNYILISDEGCHGCISATIRQLYLNTKSVFIVSRSNFKKNRKDFGFGSNRVLVDSTSVINDLSYHRGNIGVIQVANNEIYNIMDFDLYNLDNALVALK